jgi:hypothetical protein
MAAGTNTTMSITNLITQSKDICNIFFFIAVGIITILTYLKARKTVLQPFKNEVFKRQLDLFDKIMSLFNCKIEFDLRNYFGFTETIYVNLDMLINYYREICFKVKVDWNSYNTSFPYSRVPKDYALKQFEINYSYKVDQKNNNKDDDIEKWKNFEYRNIKISELTHKRTMEIIELIKTPLLPKKCANYLKQFQLAIDNNFKIMGDVLTEIAKDLPINYPSLIDLNNINYNGVWNIYFKRFESLEKISNDLTDYIRKYLTVEELLKF